MCDSNDLQMRVTELGGHLAVKRSEMSLGSADGLGEGVRLRGMSDNE